jgi:hypothetical protein
VTLRPHDGVGPVRRRRRGRLALAGVLAVAVLAAGAWFVTRPGGAEPADASVAAGLPPVATTSAAAPADPTDTATGTPSDTPTATADPNGPAPKLVGLPLADATGLLPSSITLDSTDTVDEKATDGTVLTQDPAPGAQLNGTMKVTVARQPILTYLDSQEPVNGNWDDMAASSLSGKVFPHSVGDRVSACSGTREVEYNLSKGYRKFVATAGLDDNSEDDSLAMQLEIFADGRQVYATKIQYGHPVAITVDVTTVLRLKVQFRPIGAGAGQCGDDELVLGDGRLLGLPGEVPEPSPSPTE